MRIARLELINNRINRFLYLVRVTLLKSLGLKCDYSFKIERRYVIKNCFKVEFGRNVYINDNFWCNGKGGVVVGEDALFGPNVTIHSSNHNYSSRTIPIRLQGHTDKGVTIGNNVWLGANVIILPGSEVQDGCIVGAGSVVRGTLESDSLYVGNPVRKVKKLI